MVFQTRDRKRKLIDMKKEIIAGIMSAPWD